MGRIPCTAIRLTQPAVLHIPEINKLFQRAFDAKVTLATWSPETEVELARMIASPLCGVFIGEENAQYRAALIGILPNAATMPLPTVYLIYNEGTRELMRKIADTGVEFCRAAGYTKFWGINISASDAVYKRVFGHAGTITPVGTIMEFDLERTNRREQPKL